LYEIAILLFDAVTIYFSFLLIFNLKMYLGGIIGFSFEVYNSIIAPITMIWLIVFFMGGMYKYPEKEVSTIQQVLGNSFVISSSAIITFLIALVIKTEVYFTLKCIIFVWLISILFANLSRIFVGTYLLKK